MGWKETVPHTNGLDGRLLPSCPLVQKGAQCPHANKTCLFLLDVTWRDVHVTGNLLLCCWWCFVHKVCAFVSMSVCMGEGAHTVFPKKFSC